MSCQTGWRKTSREHPSRSSVSSSFREARQRMRAGPHSTRTRIDMAWSPARGSTPKYAGNGPGWPGPLPAYGWAIQSVTALSSVPTSTPAVCRRFKGSTLFNIESEGWEPEELLNAQK